MLCRGLALSIVWTLFHHTAPLHAAPQLFTLSPLSGPIVQEGDLPRRVFVGPAHFALESALPVSSFGESLGPGDFDGDGRAELAVGLSRFRIGRRAAGRVAVFSFATAMKPRLVSSAVGNPVSQRFGARLQPCDANGDGRADLLVGIPWVSDVQRRIGMVRLFAGSSTGLVWSGAWDDLNTDASGPEQRMLAADFNRDGRDDVAIASGHFDLQAERGAGVWLFPGTPSGPANRFTWVARFPPSARLQELDLAAADVNGDGWPELLIGMPAEGNGVLRVFAGGPGGLAAESVLAVSGETPESAFGAALAAFDANHDGFMDVVVGAPGQERRRDWPGAAYLYFGSRTGLVHAAAWRASGWRAGAAFGATIAAVGDVNGDGYQDLLIGAPGPARETAIPGRASLWLGASNGLAAAPDWEVTADVDYTRLGFAVAGGDLDGDGLSDLVIGSPRHITSAGHVRVGRVDVFRGLKQGYSGAEKFPADGLVCRSGEHTVAAQFARLTNAVVSTNEIARTARALNQARRRTLWIALLTATASGLALWLWWNRRRVRAEAARLERERLARDLHDGLGSGIHRMQRLTELLSRVDTNSAEARNYREDLIRTARELAGSMDRTIWAVKPENDTLENLVTFLAAFVPSICGANGLACELDLPDSIPAWPLDGETRQTLMLAVNEALNNVMKHARARTVLLRVQWNEPWLELRIEDDGIGIDGRAIRAGGGNGLPNLGARMKALRGECRVEPRAAGGTMVMLRAPLPRP